MKKTFAAALLLTGACFSAQAITLIRSDFSNSAEDWTAINGVGFREWLPEGGAPGGHIRAVDNAADAIWLFQAPAAWLGDLSAAVGGSLSWRIKSTRQSSPITTPLADVKLGGGGLVIAADAGADPALLWSQRSVDFVPGVWFLNEINGPLATAQDIATVLGSVEFLRIRGEYSARRDAASLDTVVLTSPIPEPTPAAMLLAGVAVLAFLVRRSSSR